MLNEKEKNEMLDDGKSFVRRNDFARSKAEGHGKKFSLDDYLGYLMNIQKISPFKIAARKTITQFNKL